MLNTQKRLNELLDASKALAGVTNDYLQACINQGLHYDESAEPADAQYVELETWGMAEVQAIVENVLGDDERPLLVVYVPGHDGPLSVEQSQCKPVYQMYYDMYRAIERFEAAWEGTS